MSRQTDGKSLYEQQEERILAQSDAFISLLTKRGILGDHKIDNDKIRKAQQEKNRKSYHNTQLLLQHYLDADIARLMRLHETLSAGKRDVVVLCFAYQVAFLREYFGPLVELKVIDFDAVEDELGPDRRNLFEG